ncbi:MAG: hypothetical protein A3D10_01695 [Omnitrophica WOR_2 bacterium RIFCSPHIGHO2_02_FULL_48_11]|nr:MAG: hypothetical protein A3D10_01695 [Omnitrophica WOR_2 bacterium RIFCSPHIGHO2_02_FULL_48_11]
MSASSTLQKDPQQAVARPVRQAAFLIVIILGAFLSGCTSTLRKAPGYDQTINRVKTIAVMPPDVEVYKLTAGNVRELMDEWSTQSKRFIKKSLETHLAERFGFNIKFVEEDWLKTNHKELWNTHRALYNAVAISALLHSYPGENIFQTKVKNFDYTLGPDVAELASVCGADAFLFIYGFDHEATAGRVALWWWNLVVGAATGVTILPTNPSALMLGLVDGKTGDVIWFKTSQPQTEYSFRTEKHMDKLIEWLTRDLINKKQ